MRQTAIFCLAASGTLALAAYELWRFDHCLAAGAIAGALAGLVAAFLVGGGGEG